MLKMIRVFGLRYASQTKNTNSIQQKITLARIHKNMQNIHIHNNYIFGDAMVVINILLQGRLTIMLRHREAGV